MLSARYSIHASIAIIFTIIFHNNNQQIIITYCLKKIAPGRLISLDNRHFTQIAISDKAKSLLPCIDSINLLFYYCFCFFLSSIYIFFLRNIFALTVLTDSKLSQLAQAQKMNFFIAKVYLVE